MKNVGYVLIALLTWAVSMGCEPKSSSGMPSEYFLFVGTYTDGSSEGIYLYKFNTEDGSVDSLGVAASGVVNPSYLAFSPDHSYLYAVNELADSSEASVSSYSFDQKQGTLKFLNKQSSLGGAPCYVSVDHSGKMVFAGNYAGGSLSAFPVNEDGSLGEAERTIRHEGNSVNKNRQQSPHVHCTYVSPDNSQVWVTDLGTDKVYGYTFNADTPDIKETASYVYESEAGAGPRHLTFHPGGKYAYLINELNGSVVAFKAAGDSLQAMQTISTLPAGYEGAVSGADIHISPDGKFLYASNREDLNNIVIYKIDKGGRLKKIGQHASGGVHPRNFTIDPTGKFLLVANRNTNNIVVFKRDDETGMLAPTGTEIRVSQPVCLKMIEAD